MANENNDEPTGKDGNETRVMWIASGAIVLIIVGMMGAKVMFGSGNDTTTPSEISSQSKPGAVAAARSIAQ